MIYFHGSTFAQLSKFSTDCDRAARILKSEDRTYKVKGEHPNYKLCTRLGCSRGGQLRASLTIGQDLNVDGNSRGKN